MLVPETKKKFNYIDNDIGKKEPGYFLRKGNIVKNHTRYKELHPVCLVAESICILKGKKPDLAQVKKLMESARSILAGTTNENWIKLTWVLFFQTFWNIPKKNQDWWARLFLPLFELVENKHYLEEWFTILLRV